MSALTFITPTIGRSLISNAVASVKAQTSGDWKMIIGGDGFQPTNDFGDDRITCVEVPHFGSAGEVRNYIAMNYVDTEWVGFLDDDDDLYPDYVFYWEQIKDSVDADVIIFKMNNYGSIVPIENGDCWVTSDHVRYGNIGMSFCMKLSCLIENKFDDESKTGSGEDHRMIHNLYTKDFKIWVSNYVGYHVRRIPLV